jgi:hypothetical protein
MATKKKKPKTLKNLKTFNEVYEKYPPLDLTIGGEKTETINWDDIEWPEDEPELCNEYVARGKEIGKLVAKKRQQYGNASEKVDKIISILYPYGPGQDELNNFLLLVRVLDKVCRIAHAGGSGYDAGGESPWRDIAGYALLALDDVEENWPEDY